MGNHRPFFVRLVAGLALGGTRAKTSVLVPSQQQV